MILTIVFKNNSKPLTLSFDTEWEALEVLTLINIGIQSGSAKTVIHKEDSNEIAATIILSEVAYVGVL